MSLRKFVFGAIVKSDDNDDVGNIVAIFQSDCHRSWPVFDNDCVSSSEPPTIMILIAKCGSMCAPSSYYALPRPRPTTCPQTYEVTYAHESIQTAIGPLTPTPVISARTGTQTQG